MSSTSKAGADIAVPALEELVAALYEAEPGVRERDAEALHAMRVLVRRIRAVLAAFATEFDADRVEDLRDRLRLFGAVLGEARDLDVRANDAATLFDGLDDQVDTTDARTRIVDGTRIQFDEALDRVIAYLDSEPYDRIRRLLEAFVTVPPFADDGSVPDGKPAVKKQHRRIVRRAERLSGVEAETPAELAALHEVRKAARRLRYTAEAVAAVDEKAGKRTTKLAARAERLQDDLGDHRDRTLLAEFLLFESNRADAAGESTYALGVAHETLAARAVEARDAANKQLRKLTNAH